MVPMIGSLGCPYTCSFCIDSTVDYQPLGFGRLRDDLKFLLTKIKNPIVGWHDPNFGVRFDDYMEAVEAAVPEGRIRHIAESSLSLLNEKHLQRLRKNGFRAILPGIESWYDLGNKSKTRRTGMDKVKQVSEHVNMILRYIPYIQTNFVHGSRRRHGAGAVRADQEVHRSIPGAFPAYSLLSAFGRAAPMNLEYQRAGQGSALPVPFPEQQPRDERPAQELFLARVLRSSGGRHPLLVFLEGYCPPHPRHPTAIPKWMNVVRAVSSEGFGRIRYHETIRRLLDTDRSVRDYMEGESRYPAGVLRGADSEGAGAGVRVPAGGRAVPRSQRVSARHHRACPQRTGAARRTSDELVALGRVLHSVLVAGPGAGAVAALGSPAAPKLEVLLRHQPFPLGSCRCGQVPEQQLLAHRGGREPDAGLRRLG